MTCRIIARSDPAYPANANWAPSVVFCEVHRSYDVHNNRCAHVPHLQDCVLRTEIRGSVMIELKRLAGRYEDDIGGAARPFGRFMADDGTAVTVHVTALRIGGQQFARAGERGEVVAMLRPPGWQAVEASVE